MSSIEDIPSVLERLSVRLKSSNLRFDLERRTDVDYVIALGAAELQQAKSRDPTMAIGASTAGKLLHLHIAGGQAAYRSALESVHSLASHLNAKHDWQLEPRQLRRVSSLALGHHVAPVCPACNGQGYHMMPGAPRKSDRACDTCGGTGLRPIPRRNRQEIRQLVGVLEALDHALEGAVARYLRN